MSQNKIMCDICNKELPICQYSKSEQKRYSKGFSSRCKLCVHNEKMGYCEYCGKFCCLTKDHIVPKALGGITIYSNIAFVCRTCNERKGQTPLYEWINSLPPNAPQKNYITDEYFY